MKKNWHEMKNEMNEKRRHILLTITPKNLKYISKLSINKLLSSFLTKSQVSDIFQCQKCKRTIETFRSMQYY